MNFNLCHLKIYLLLYDNATLCVSVCVLYAVQYAIMNNFDSLRTNALTRMQFIMHVYVTA